MPDRCAARWRSCRRPRWRDRGYPPYASASAFPASPIRRSRSACPRHPWPSAYRFRQSRWACRFHPWPSVCPLRQSRWGCPLRRSRSACPHQQWPSAYPRRRSRLIVATAGRLRHPPPVAVCVLRHPRPWRSGPAPPAPPVCLRRLPSQWGAAGRRAFSRRLGAFAGREVAARRCAFRWGHPHHRLPGPSPPPAVAGRRRWRASVGSGAPPGIEVPVTRRCASGRAPAPPVAVGVPRRRLPSQWSAAGRRAQSASRCLRRASRCRPHPAMRFRSG